MQEQSGQEQSGEAGMTGDAQVDEALRPLETLEGLPVHEHATVVEGVHRALQARLTRGEQPDVAGEEG